MKKFRVCVNVKMISLIVVILALTSTQAIASYVIEFSGALDNTSNHCIGQSSCTWFNGQSYSGTLTFNTPFEITNNPDQQIGTTTASGSITSNGLTLSIAGAASVNVLGENTYPNSYGITINQFGGTQKTVWMSLSSDKSNPFLPNVNVIQPTEVLQAASTTYFSWEEVARDANQIPTESYRFSGTINNVTTNNSPVPIPAAVWLLGSGLIGLIGVRRLKK